MTDSGVLSWSVVLAAGEECATCGARATWREWARGDAAAVATCDEHMRTARVGGPVIHGAMNHADEPSVTSSAAYGWIRGPSEPLPWK